MSLWWILVVCLSYLYSEWRHTHRLHSIDKVNFVRKMHQGDELRSCLRDQIPVWITFPDVQKAEWLASEWRQAAGLDGKRIMPRMCYLCVCMRCVLLICITHGRDMPRMHMYMPDHISSMLMLLHMLLLLLLPMSLMHPGTLQDLWPMVKIATETSMMQSLTPIFDASCPSFLSAIKIHTLDLGDISPTIPGVKVRARPHV